ncbi:MAG: DsbA family protein [Rhizobiaceae bacterium]|nr:DsbA family protein [Rhizobiaceae bacterium]
MKFPKLTKSKALLVLISLAFAFLGLPGPSLALDAKDKSEVETIIRDYLLKNPEIFIEVQQALEAKQKLETASAQKRTLTEKHDLIYNSKHQLEIGDPNAPITIVEFFDYNCGFCQRALADMNRFIEEDKNVRFILKEFPVLGEASVQAHRVSLAFSRLMPEKVEEFHTELLSKRGRKNGKVAAELAMSYGVEEADLVAEMEKPYIVAAMREVYELADGLAITGTPSYIIGDQVIFGAVGYAQLKAKIAKIGTN